MTENLKNATTVLLLGAQALNERADKLIATTNRIYTALQNAPVPEVMKTDSFEYYDEVVNLVGIYQATTRELVESLLNSVDQLEEIHRKFKTRE